jgi:NifU-like protein involved in Fe-S cluster formation
MVYSEAVVDHATRPRNVGALPGAHAVGTDGDPMVGNRVQVYLRLEGARVVEARFKAFGCSATIAAASMMTELVSGVSLDAARGLDAAAIECALGGLPQEKRHCAAVAAGALRRALASVGPAISSGSAQDGEQVPATER